MNSSLENFRPSVAFHPGETLEEKLEELGIGPKEFAVRTGKPEKTIIAVIKGKSSITAEMAVLFDRVLGIPAHFWLNKQAHYDEWMVRQKLQTNTVDDQAWAEKFPYADMVKKGWVPSVSGLQDKTQALLRFFGVGSPGSWEDIYLHQELKVAFRISLAHTKEPHAISAWLRQGELQAQAITCQPYAEKAFKAALPMIKKIMATHPPDWFQQLKQLCADAGVKVVYTPCINKAPINGCTRWLNDTPLIQLSGRHKRNDIFWFTFFHEAGHILLHGKKDIFLESEEEDIKNAVQEQQADDFAETWTFSRKEEQEFLKSGIINEDNIIQYAHRYSTHPALIVGRLQRNHLMSYAVGKDLLIRIDLEDG